MLLVYKLRIKEEVPDISHPVSSINNSKDFHLEICKYMDSLRILNERFQRNFISVTNLIVSVGGVVDLRKDSLEADWRIFLSEIRVKIPEESVEVIRSHPCVDYLDRV